MNFKSLYILSIFLASTDNRACDNLQFSFDDEDDLKALAPYHVDSSESNDLKEGKNNFSPTSKSDLEDNPPEDKDKFSTSPPDSQNDDELQLPLEGEFRTSPTRHLKSDEKSDDSDTDPTIFDDTKDTPSPPHQMTDKNQTLSAQKKATTDITPLLGSSDFPPTRPISIVYPENYQGGDW